MSDYFYSLEMAVQTEVVSVPFISREDASTVCLLNNIADEENQ